MPHPPILQHRNGKAMKNKRTEASTGALNYALNFIILISVLIFYMFAKYRVNLYFLQRTIENDLYMIESSALTLESDETYHTDEFYREYIIHDIDISSINISLEEQTKLNNLGLFIQNRMQQQMDLKNNVNPNSGILKIMCSDTGKVYLDEVKVIQPHYAQAINVNPTGDPASPYEITYSFSIDKWVVYSLLYEDNTYKGCTKLEIREGNDPPVLKYADPLGDNLAHGATIEASIKCRLTGINDIFHGVETTGTIFTVDSPLRKILDNNLTYCLSTDIVISARDNRDMSGANGSVSYRGSVQKRQSTIFNSNP